MCILVKAGFLKYSCNCFCWITLARVKMHFNLFSENFIFKGFQLRPPLFPHFGYYIINDWLIDLNRLKVNWSLDVLFMAQIRLRNTSHLGALHLKLSQYSKQCSINVGCTTESPAQEAGWTEHSPGCSAGYATHLPMRSHWGLLVSLVYL